MGRESNKNENTVTTIQTSELIVEVTKMLGKSFTRNCMKSMLSVMSNASCICRITVHQALLIFQSSHLRSQL